MNILHLTETFSSITFTIISFEYEVWQLSNKSTYTASGLDELSQK